MLEFSKLEGTGNDFIIIDNCKGSISNYLKEEDISIKKFVKTVCNRKKGIGADGLILIEESKKADFKWQFFNSDGSTATMCGNGARCAARYAYKKGLASENMLFETGAGIIEATVKEKTVKVLLTKPYNINFHLKAPVENKEIVGAFLNTGVPHFVVFVDDIENTDVNSLGKKIRHHRLFQPEGTNVNFAQYRNGKLYVRTYERGVEGETLACGTGSVAAAISYSKIFNTPPLVEVITRSKEKLTVCFDENFEKVYLEGNTSWICDGTIKEEIFG